MVTYSWDPNGYSFDWENNKNWTPNGVPGPNDDVVVDGERFKRKGPTPPAGASIRTLELRSGILNGRVRVREAATWSGGHLVDGLDVRDLTVRGDNWHIVTGEINGSGTLSLEGATFGGGHGALIRGFRRWSCEGDNRIRDGGGGANMILRVEGAMNVRTGTLSVQGHLETLLAGPVRIAAGASLEFTRAWAYVELGPRSRVTGGGTLRLEGGASAYCRPGSVVDSGVVMLVKDNSQIGGKRPDWAIGAGETIAQSRPRLHVLGILHVQDGSLYGDVEVGAKGSMIAGGREVYIRDCAIAVAGSFEVMASTRVNAILGTLLLAGRSTIGPGCELSSIRNTGTLTTRGPGLTSFAKGPVDNRGIIIVESGELELPHNYSQQNGVLEAGDEARISCGTTLRLESGTLRGSGTVGCSVEQRGATVVGKRFTKNAPAEPGILRIEGDYAQVGTQSRLLLRIDGYTPATEHSALDVTGTVDIQGTLELVGLAFSPPVGAQMDVIRANPASVVEGRFNALKLPTSREASMRETSFLRLVYEANFARLAGSRVHPGFDIQRMPNDRTMTLWLRSSPYRWVNYYLDAYCHRPSNWVGNRDNLTAIGWDILVTYVGHQDPGTNCRRPMTLTTNQGRTDGLDAAISAANEGFPTGTWIYLDVEVSETRHSDEMLDYIDGWTSGVLGEGSFNPAVYVHRRDADLVIRAMVTAFRRFGRTDRPRSWVVGGPANPALDDPPHVSGVPEAIAWQQPPLDRNVTWSDITMRVDVNNSVLENPSWNEFPARHTVVPLP